MNHHLHNLSRITLLFWSSWEIAIAQPGILWTKTIGGNADDHGRSVQQTLDGGYVVVGHTKSFGNGSEDVWLIKTDTSGDTLWTKTFGRSGEDWGNSVQQTADSGYIVVGWTELSSYDLDVWLIKTNADGDTLWNKTFGGFGIDIGSSVQQTTDGGYIIAGRTDSYGVGDPYVWLIKTNSSGNEIWDNTFGGSHYDGGSFVQQTADGGFIITGSTASYDVGGGDDVWLIKTDSSGNEEWNQAYGGWNYDVGRSVQQTSDGGYIIVGTTLSYGLGGYEDAWLIKTNAVGDTSWTKTLGGNDRDEAYSIQQTSDGGYIIVGYTYPRQIYPAVGDAWITKTNSVGNKEWSLTIGGAMDDGGTSVQQTNDDGYIITGYSVSSGMGAADVWLIRLASEALHVEEQTSNLPMRVKLQQNYPNPFNPTTTLRFDLPAATHVRIVVFDLLGREVTRLVDRHLEAGYQRVVWGGRDSYGREVPTGMYIARMVTPLYTKSIKMVLLK